MPTENPMHELNRGTPEYDAALAEWAAQDPRSAAFYDRWLACLELDDQPDAQAVALQSMADDFAGGDIDLVKKMMADQNAADD